MRQWTLLSLLCFLFLVACKQQAHHQAVDDELLSRMQAGLSECYQLDEVTRKVNVNTKQQRNLAYKLSMHAKNHPQKLQAILNSDPDIDASVRRFAKSGIAVVQRHEPDYPIIPIFEMLFAEEQLSDNQALVLLACTAKMLSESGAQQAEPGAH